MEVKLFLEDDEVRCFLAAKRCMESEFDEDLDEEEFVARLAEFYLDVKKGEKEIYETDELD